MKLMFFLLPLAVVFLGCAEQSNDDWYDQSVQHNQEKDSYIDSMVDAGMDPKEARQMHDRQVWEMNTINMSKESGPKAERP